MKTDLSGLFFTVFLPMLVALPTMAADNSRYEEMMRAPATSSTVLTYANALLVLPTERKSLEVQLQQRWWANSPELSLDSSQRKIEAATLRSQLDAAEKAVEKHALRELILMGFTQVGTAQNLEFYYASNSHSGPVIFRVSVVFREDKYPLLFGIHVYEGFDQAREVIPQVQYFAGSRIARISLDEKTGDQESDQTNTP